MASSSSTQFSEDLNKNDLNILVLRVLLNLKNIGWKKFIFLLQRLWQLSIFLPLHQRRLVMRESCVQVNISTLAHSSKVALKLGTSVHLCLLLKMYYKQCGMNYFSTWHKRIGAPSSFSWKSNIFSAAFVTVELFLSDKASACAYFVKAFINVKISFLL